MGVDDLRIKLFADGADLAGMVEMYADPKIKGFTTNPTLMNKAGVADYEAFSRDLLFVAYFEIRIPLICFDVNSLTRFLLTS